MTDWFDPVGKARMAGQDILSRLDALELLVARHNSPTINAPDLTAFSKDMGTWTSGQLYYGTGDINDLTTLPTGLFIDAVGVHIYNNGVEVGRFGNLLGFLTYITTAFGIGIGDANGYLLYDPAEGLRIKGLSGVFGLFPTHFDVFYEIPQGVPDGSRIYFQTKFQSAGIIVNAQVVLNGLWLRQGVGSDYSFVGSSSFFMNTPPRTGDVLSVNYYDTANKTFVYNEIPFGSINSSNADFNTHNNLLPGSIEVFLNGICLTPISDFFAGSGVLKMATPPQALDLLTIGYLVALDSKLYFQIIPLGTQNGVNKVFTIPNGFSYVAGTLIVVLNSVKQTIANDYTESSSTTFTMTNAPLASDLLWFTCILQ